MDDQPRCKARNLLMLENQNFDELTRKEEQKKLYQKQLLDQIEARKRRLEEEKARKKQEDKEEELRIKKFLAETGQLTDPQTRQLKQFGQAQEVPNYHNKIDSLDREVTQQDEKYKSQKDFSAIHRTDSQQKSLPNNYPRVSTPAIDIAKRRQQQSSGHTSYFHQPDDGSKENNFESNNYNPNNLSKASKDSVPFGRGHDLKTQFFENQLDALKKLFKKRDL